MPPPQTESRGPRRKRNNRGEGAESQEGEEEGKRKKEPERSGPWGATTVGTRERVSRPLVGFGGLIDTTIKGLTILLSI